MTDALLSEFLIALFAGMVAFAIFRKNTPRPVELLLWAGLVWVCVLGVTGIHDKQARDLTSATFWGATQMVGSVGTLALLSVKQWMVDNRFVLADWAILIAGADLLALTFLVSRRQANGWRPRVRLRDWMEVPPAAPVPKRVAPAAYAVDELNRRVSLWAPVAGAAALMWATLLLIWTGDVVAPIVGRRIKKVAVGAQGARRRVAESHLTDKVVDIADLSRRAARARLRAATWLTEGGTNPVQPDGENESDDKHERDRRGRLAS